jgi:hypothetical protein
MIAVNHQRLGMNVRASGDTASPIIGPGGRYLPAAAPVVSASPSSSLPPTSPGFAPLVKSPSTETSSPSSAWGPLTPASVPSTPAEQAADAAQPTWGASLPVLVSGIVDPVTGISYSGYLTPDAQTLYQNGSLVSGGNKLTTQGSALAAQGDLITGTPAPSTAQVAAASATLTSPATDPWTSFTNWLSSETVWAGVPNGLIAAGGVFAIALLFGGKKGRR